jgi:hypothetical protein
MRKLSLQFVGIFYILIGSQVTGCGVKGKPQPPLIPAFIGRGEPSFAKSADKPKSQNQSKKKIEGDFEESDDFESSVETNP